MIESWIEATIKPPPLSGLSLTPFDSHVDHAHRGARMSGIGGLDGVHCQRADRVGHQGLVGHVIGFLGHVGGERGILAAASDRPIPEH